ncbi:MAG: AAA family ATPase, partial [Alphaproteobacteria bacterium]|nr:AAA family ATPase [Alphaproteobacteria bacterium]
MGISKINNIENLGFFDPFQWPQNPADISFKKINILYGYNGSGKTTLSNILGLFSEEHDDISRKKVIDGLRADDTRDYKIELDWDGKTIKSFEENKKIQVFNSAFIADHVYNGTQSKPLSFKGNVVTEEQLSNATIKGLTDKIIELQDKQKDVIKQLELLKELAVSVKKSLSTKWNDNIEGRRLPSNLKIEDCIQTSPEKDQETLEKELDEQFEKFKISKDQTALQNDITELKNLTHEVLQKPVYVENDISSSVSENAKEKLKEQVALFQDADLEHTTIQNWYEDGKTLLEHAKDHKVCPLCSSKLPNIEELINSYNDYFSDELALLLETLQKHIDIYTKNCSRIETWQTLAINTNNLINKYRYQKHLSSKELGIIQNLTLGEIKKQVKTAQALVQDKKDNITKVITEEHISIITECSSFIEQYNENIEAFSKIQKSFIEKLEASLFDTSLAKKICGDLFWKRFDNEGSQIADSFRTEKEIDKPQNHGGIEFYWFLKEAEAALQRNLIKYENDRGQELAKLKQESKYVNKFLSQLRISHFEISYDDKAIVINFLGKKPKKGIHYTLSEGEKTALAFAYFLSKYQYEILDNQDQNVTPEDHIIVLDDPISSLDENRLFSTALLIHKVLFPQALETDKIIDQNKNEKKYVKSWSGCQQIFVFSHNLIFLKFLNNLIESNQSLDRADFYLEKGELHELPPALRNYQTSYFYKLSKIQSFFENSIDYEEVKDFLPNYIRICLEAFISFKFARLKQGASSDKYKPAMLDKLISGLKVEDFSSFKTIRNISNKEDLLTILQEIKNKVNPECHGTSQEITHLEYLSETELKELVDNVMNVFEYLDQLHFSKTQK